LATFVHFLVFLKLLCAPQNIDFSRSSPSKSFFQMRISPQLVRSIEKLVCLSARWVSTQDPSTALPTRTVSAAFQPRRLLTQRGNPPLKASQEDFQKPELIIFDKDGTLICFHSMWIPWAMDTAKRLEQATGLPLSLEVYRLLGLCPVEGKVRPGLLAEGTLLQIKLEMQKLLIANGRNSERDFSIIDECIKDSQSRCPSTLRAIQDMRSLFSALKEHDVKIAVCTADNRENTMVMLRWFGVEDLVDIVVCGDDPGSKPKPHPHNAISICRILQVAPENAVMVGDTPADLRMAKAAGLGAAVGVLSGIGSLDHLESHADILIPHVGNLLPIFLGTD
ncbi:Choline dehydrogenase mitochondriallike [Xiphosphorus maculatus], partial [Trichostrongylus colubriformis]